MLAEWDALPPYRLSAVALDDGIIKARSVTGHVVLPAGWKGTKALLSLIAKTIVKRTMITIKPR